MSTSENGSQPSPSIQESTPLLDEKESTEEILSSHEDHIPNGEDVVNTSDSAPSIPPSPLASQNGSNMTLQSDNFPPDSPFHSSDLHNLSQVTVDTAPEIHPTETIPSSEMHSQDSQDEKNGKEQQEEYLDTFDPEPSSSLNPLDQESMTQDRDNSEMEDSSDHSSEFDLDDPSLRYAPHPYDQLAYANYIFTPQDQLRICLDKNLQYQAWIKHQLQLIEYVEMKLKEDQDRLQTLAKNATKGTRAQAKNMVTLRKFFPYFRDQNGLPPPVDKQAIKNEAHQHGLYDKPSSKWTEKERQDLAKGVRMQNLEAQCRPLLLALENATDPRARDLRREIDSIKKKPDHELELTLDGIEWDKLAIDMTPNRHPVECRLQWIQIDHPLVSRKIWNKQEDKTLLKLAKEYKERDWNTIAMRLKSNRTPVQCLQRYQTALNTEHVKREWSRDDDEKLREAVAKCGVGNWQEVANFMGNSHTGAQCLNRWDKTIKPTFRKGKWTEEEDDLLKKGVDYFGIGNWKKIASIVTSRTDVQCRERWVNILDPTIDHGKWTRGEDEILLRFVSKFGPGKWSQLASVMGSRTDNMVMRRWEKLNKPGVVAKYRLLRLKAKFARGADSKVKATLEPEDLDISILPEKAREKVRRIKRSAGKIRRHSSRTAYDCPYEKDRPYAKPIRPTKKYATLGRPKGSKSRLIFRESDTDVLGSDISILEGEVVQFTDGKVPAKKSKLRRKRRNPDAEYDSSDEENEGSRMKPTKKRHRRQEGDVLVDGSDADISCSDDDIPYKRDTGIGAFAGLSTFLSFMPNRPENSDLSGANFSRWEFQTRPQFPVIPHKPKGKQRGRPRETFWDKTFPSFQESQVTRKPLSIDDPTLEAEIAQFMTSHTSHSLPQPPPATSIPPLHTHTPSHTGSLPSLHSTTSTEPPTPTSPVLAPQMAKLSLFAKQTLEKNIKKPRGRPGITSETTEPKSPLSPNPPPPPPPALPPTDKQELNQLNLTEGELQTLQSGDNLPAMASVIARRKTARKKLAPRGKARRNLKRINTKVNSKCKTKRSKLH